MKVDRLLRSKFKDWKADPFEDRNVREQLTFKYKGQYAKSSVPIPCEYQIVSTLIGLFLDVEHAAIYKQAPDFKGLEPVMRGQTSAVYLALKEFENEFERQLKKSVSNYRPSGLVFARRG